MQYISELLTPVNTQLRRDRQGNTIPTTALVTGGSEGIGKELAKLFARDGYSLVLVAQNEEKLRKAAQEMRELGAPSAVTISWDLAQDGAAVRLVHELDARGINVDVLVNNAGFTRIEGVLESDVETLSRLMHLNMISMVVLCRMLVPKMIARGYGRILNLGSIAGCFAGPYQCVYNATKAFVLSFGSAFALELQDTPVTLTTMCPGLTETQIFARHKANTDKDKVDKTPGKMGADETALLGYKALFRGETQYICGMKNYVIGKMSNFLPTFVTARLARRMHLSWK